MKGVILAAGDGRRLLPATLQTSKVLLDVGGQPLIHYAVEALADAGVSDTVVVVGYQGQAVSAALGPVFPDLGFIQNDDYLGGNALSIYAARDFVSDEPFLVCMGDNPIGFETIRQLLSTGGNGNTLCVDTMASDPSQISDGNRVVVDSNGYISSIGKDLTVWNAIDTGVFQMTRAVFNVIDMLVRTKGIHVEINDIVRHLIGEESPFFTCDVSGMFWADVDTRADLETTDRLLRERHVERV